jgi:chitodextrinase
MHQVVTGNRHLLPATYIMTVLVLLLLASTSYGQGSIFGEVTNSDASVPGNDEISFFGYLDDTDEEIRIESCVGAGYEDGHWYDDFQNYLTEAAGNPYDFHFYNSTNDEGAVLSKLIPANSYQQEDIVLAPASWPDSPSGLTGQAVSSSSVVLSWAGNPDLTYHVYRVKSSSRGSLFRIDDPSGSLSNPGVADSFFVDTGVDGVSNYDYLVIAEDASGNLGPHSELLTVSSSTVQPPIITAITPDTGLVTGGESVTITGSGFDMAGATATIGGIPLSSIIVVSPFEITGLTPPGSAGAADILVTNTASGLSSTPLAAGFTYVEDLSVPEVAGIFLDGDDTPFHVINHSPLIEWIYHDPSGENPQTQFEIGVGADDDWAISEMWNPAPFAGPDTSIVYAGAELIDGERYYLRLRVNNGLNWSVWYELAFWLNSLPSVPVPLTPINDTIVNSSPATMYVQNSTDAEDDVLTYIYMLCDFQLYDTLVSPEIAEDTDSTGLAFGAYPENSHVWWRARAYDGYEYSSWSDSQTYWINAVEEDPTAFDLIYPPDTGWSQVCDFPTLFWWHESSDNDPYDSIYYRLLVATDSDFASVTTYDSLYESCCALPGFARMIDLEYSTHYWWKVYAIDTKGNMTRSNGVADFLTWVLGDANQDGAVNVGDAVFLISYVFKGGDGPYPLKVGDVNADCNVNVGDAVYLISYIFRGGEPPQVGCAE